MEELIYKKYTGSVSLDNQTNKYSGVVNTKDVITYEADTIELLQKEFEESIEDYLEFCITLEREPSAPYKLSKNQKMNTDIKN